MTRIINFFGAPKSRKKNAMAKAFVRAKKKGFSAHFVQEYASELILRGDLETPKNQKKLFAEQLKRIKQADTKTDFVMVDFPLSLNIVYHRYRQNDPNLTFKQEVLKTHESFNPTNVLLKYNPKYDTSKGRLTSQEESFVIEKKIKDFLQVFRLSKWTALMNLKIV